MVRRPDNETTAEDEDVVHQESQSSSREQTDFWSQTPTHGPTSPHTTSVTWTHWQISHSLTITSTDDPRDTRGRRAVFLLSVFRILASDPATGQ